MSIERLRWGLAGHVPADATSAWGARAIVTQDGDVDFLPDRQDRVGSTAIFDVLDAGYPMPALRQDLRDLLASGEMSTRRGGEHVLHKSPSLTVVADTRGSAGYCYIAAWTTRPEGA